MRKLQLWFASIFACAFCSPALAINIELEYPAGFLFSATHDAAAKAAINSAAADLSSAITTSLNAVTTDAYTGSNGATTITLGWQFHYTDPVSNSPVTISNATIAANAVVMHVGARNLTGSTLGVGGPGQLGGDSSQFTGGGSPGQWVGAVANAETMAENAYKRGGGPILQAAMGSATLGAVTANYSVDFTIAHGALSLDWDSNNNGVKDSDAELNAYWHFNHTTPVSAGKSDLYSVALHEMLHAIGIGTSNSWTSLVSGSTWGGSEVIDVYGTGSNLVGGGHITEGTMSTSIVDGSPQEVVMDPSVFTGTRKYLTALDLAFLRDIGYSTIIPDPQTFSPADFNEDSDVDASDLLAWQGAYGLNGNGDTDDDDDTDGRDFLVWQREYTGPLPFSANVAVPEPGSAALLALGLISWFGSRRRS